MTQQPPLPTRRNIEAAMRTEQMMQRELRRRLWREMTLLYPVAAVGFGMGIFLTLITLWVFCII